MQVFRRKLDSIAGETLADELLRAQDDLLGKIRTPPPPPPEDETPKPAEEP